MLLRRLSDGCNGGVRGKRGDQSFSLVVNDGDATTMDPQARSDGFVTSFDMNINEPLVSRDRNLKIEQGLAIERSNLDPTTLAVQTASGGQVP